MPERPKVRRRFLKSAGLGVAALSAPHGVEGGEAPAQRRPKAHGAAQPWITLRHGCLRASARLHSDAWTS
jgi:hypothetical protein